MAAYIAKIDVFKKYINHVSRIEESKSCFICADCPNNFSFLSCEDFKAHNCIIESKTHFQCVYCGLLVFWKQVEQHINNHFKHQLLSLYNCPSCMFTSNNVCKLKQHVISHTDNNNTHLNYRCNGCETTFVSVDGLIKHVHFYTIAIYNCCVVNCLVKSSDKKQILEHYKRLHPTKTISYEISLILACSEGTPDVQYTRQLVERVPHLGPELTMGRLNPTLRMQRKTSFVYLECFKCDFSTTHWHNFIRHYFKCGSFDKYNNEQNCFYACSCCYTMSTKKHLVEEHLLECNRNATVLVEFLPIRTMQEPNELIIKSEKMLPCKRSHSLCSESREMTNCKRARINDSPESKCKSEEAKHLNAKPARINDSPESKCKTEEAIFSDYDGEDLNTEFVSIPFDEERFRVNNPNIPYHQKETIITKMRQFSQSQINIVGKENYGRIPECPDCHKIFTYGFGDFKRHFISVHLSIEKEYIKECLKYTSLPKGGDKFQEMQEQLTMRNLRPKALDKGKIRVPLPYSIVALRELTKCLPQSTQQYLAEKMKAYSIMSIIIQNFDNSRRFLCNQCSYSSPYALADVRKHIMGSHCGISTKHFRYCLQVSRLDPNEFTLLTDEKILNLAEELSRRTKQKRLNVSSSSPNHNTSNTNLTKSTKLSHNPRYQKWSKSAKSKSHSISPIKNESLYVLSPHNHSLGGRKGVNSLFLNADSNFNLTLPFSEKVLRTLLQSVIADDQISGIIKKMKLYANYSLKRLCKNERTVAFQCPCGRVFHTARIPDLKMRAATLADARRHVMGVHAKIPQSLITVCCQASRICRENDFQIYSDEMLLQLASERQSKLPDSQSRSNARGDSSSKSHDCQADSSADPGEPTNDRDISSPIPMPMVNTSASQTNSFLLTQFSDDETRLEPDLPKEEKSFTLNVEEFGVGTNDSATSRLDAEKSKIERIIHLPYSLEALKCLTDGYCEPSFFPVLQEKMNIYSKYKIFIIRPEGRRIFCCSGCPSSSPHGMGDVKKHILGVHARIPERFKAAAMHCSRLSREDTSLLPDHLLLQLAKMKWKGSVIKPLSELTVEDRIKNFSKKNWEGKHKNPSKLPNYYSMVEQPLFTKTGKESTVTPKAEPADINDDSGLSNGASEIVVPAELFVELHQRQSKVTYKCSQCEYESRFVGNSKGHIVREHLGIPAHTCSICEQLFNSRSSVVFHHEQDHCDTPFTLAHYGPYKIAISKVTVEEIASGQNCPAVDASKSLNKNRKSVVDGKRNSFLQNSQDPVDVDMYLI